MPDAAQNIPLPLVFADPGQPRKKFDPVELKELADSMAEIGQIHPILVRPHPERPGAFMLVAGERRWRAAQKGNFPTIRAEVRDLAESQIADIQLAENEARAKPKESDTARFIALRIGKGDSLEKIAKALGKSAGWVKMRQSMAGLTPAMMDLLDDGKLAAGVAAALGELPQEVQRNVYEAATAHSSAASGQEAYVRAVVLREMGKDIFGQSIVEHVSGISPRERKALIHRVEKQLRCAHGLKSAQPEDISTYAQISGRGGVSVLEELKDIARFMLRAAHNVEKVSAARAVAGMTGTDCVMCVTAPKPAIRAARASKRSGKLPTATTDAKARSTRRKPAPKTRRSTPKRRPAARPARPKYAKRPGIMSRALTAIRKWSF